jgi:hypothetical protein
MNVSKYDLEEDGRGLFEGSIPAFVGGKPRKLRIAGNAAEIRIGYFPSTHQQRVTATSACTVLISSVAVSLTTNFKTLFTHVL